MKMHLSLRLLALAMVTLFAACTGGTETKSSTTPTPTLDPARPNNGTDKQPGKHCFRSKADGVSLTAELEVAADNGVTGSLQCLHETESAKDYQASFAGKMDGDKLSLRVDRTEGGSRSSAEEVWAWDKEGLHTLKEVLPAGDCGN
ncbi:MAG: hypothetical protein U0176_03630 [Bacteroidia bacterium]